METISDLDSNIDAAKNVAAQQESHRNEPARIVERLKQSLPAGTVVEGSFKKGGTVPKTGAFLLHKGETVIPAQTSQPANASQPQAPAQTQDPTQTAPTAQPDAQSGTAQDDSNLPDADAGAPVKIHRAFSKMNAAIAELFDGSAVRRAFSVPYVDGGAMHDHIAAVGAAASQTGGFTNNLLVSYHHATGKGWGSGDGETIGYPATKLKDTLIPKDDANAIKAIAATKSLVNQIASLIGDDDQSIQIAKSHLALVSKHNSESMTLLDLGVALQNIVVAPLKALARAHSEHKHGGIHVKLTAPKAR